MDWLIDWAAKEGIRIGGVRDRTIRLTARALRERLRSSRDSS
jgi:hypothetical protein